MNAFLQKSLNFNCFNGTEGTWLRTPCHLDEKHSAEKSNFKKPGYSLFLRLIELKPYMGSSSTLKLTQKLNKYFVKELRSSKMGEKPVFFVISGKMEKLKIEWKALNF